MVPRKRFVLLLLVGEGEVITVVGPDRVVVETEVSGIRR